MDLVKVKNTRNEIKLTIAVASETSLNVVLKTPRVSLFPLLIHRGCLQCILSNCFVTLQRTIYKLGMALPVSLPIRETAAELEPYQTNWSDQLSYMLTKAYAGKDF